MISQVHSKPGRLGITIFAGALAIMAVLILGPMAPLSRPGRAADGGREGTPVGSRAADGGREARPVRRLDARGHHTR